MIGSSILNRLSSSRPSPEQPPSNTAYTFVRLAASRLGGARLPDYSQLRIFGPVETKVIVFAFALFLTETGKIALSALLASLGKNLVPL